MGWVRFSAPWLKDLGENTGRYVHTQLQVTGRQSRKEGYKGEEEGEENRGREYKGQEENKREKSEREEEGGGRREEEQSTREEC